MSAYDILVQEQLKQKGAIPMEHIHQPPKSRLCGQTCIAMILGITLDESIALFGHKKGTRTKEIIKVLQAKGYICETRLVPLRKSELPPLCLCKIVRTSKKTGNWHWIVHNHGTFFDPSFGIFIDRQNLDSYYTGWELTSFLTITKA